MPPGNERALDRLHSTVYFVPDANERFGALGMDGRTHYFRQPVYADRAG